jgi:dTDP-4-dehydrorhamnose reductase
MDLNLALITGGNGMVGSNINFGYKPTSKQMDICDIHSIENYINQISNISCVIHLAATNLRESENNIQKAIDVNINGTTNILYFAKKYNIPFILISTGAVFSSNNSNIIFTEKCISNPNSVYGFTKSAS